MADLSNVVRMLIHQLDATRSYLLPGYCDEDEKARAVIAFAESALAAETTAPAEPVATLHVSDFRGYENYDFQHLVDLPPGHYKLFTACTAQPPAPGPTTDDIWELCEDHEFHLGEGCDDEASAEIMLRIIRVALTRWGRPAPDLREVIAVRPLLEAVVALDVWGVEIYDGRLPALQHRIRAWLAENPPGQPVAIEPRGCPTSGACSCVEPPTDD